MVLPEFLKNVNYTILMNHKDGMLIEVDFTSIFAELISASLSVQDKLKWYVEFKAYGNVCKMKRGICDFRKNIEKDASPLVFSKIPFFPQVMTRELLLVQENISKLLGIDFNACLVNSYDKDDQICAHSDDEDTVVKHFGVMSINCGPGSRLFRVQEKKSESKGKTYDFISRPFYGLLMYGDNFQFKYTHAILKNKIPKSLWPNGVIDKNEKASRTSITFRMHDEVQASQNEKKRIIRVQKADTKNKRQKIETKMEGCDIDV